MLRELLPPEHGRNGPAPADGNSPLRQVLAAPEGDAGLLACSAPAKSNVLAGLLAGEVRADGHSSLHRRENLKVVSFAANSRTTMAIWAAGVAHCPGHLSPTRPESHLRLSSPFSGIPAVSVFPGTPAGPRTGAASRRDTGRRRVQGAQARAAPRMIDTARIRGRRPHQI
jgi:hypothetical protein